MRVQIENAREAKIAGVGFCFIDDEKGVEDKNFKWIQPQCPIRIQNDEILLGALTATKDEVRFDAVEYHDKTEIFYYYAGKPLICFCKIVDGKVDMGSVRIVEAPQNTVVKIEKNIGHFVPVTMEEEEIKALVISGKDMKTFNVEFDEPVCGE